VCFIGLREKLSAQAYLRFATREIRAELVARTTAPLHSMDSRAAVLSLYSMLKVALEQAKPWRFCLGRMPPLPMTSHPQHHMRISPS
jgi:hypothetical protein